MRDLSRTRIEWLHNLTRGKAMTTKKKRFVALFVATACTMALVGVASAAGPYANLATFNGNGTACGNATASGCGFKSFTVSGSPLVLTVKPVIGSSFTLQCDESNVGVGWNPGGAPFMQNDSLNNLSFTNCSAPGFPSCTVTASANTTTPWVTEATKDNSTPPNFADQLQVPSGVASFTLAGSCPTTPGTYFVSGTLNAAATNGSGPTCNTTTGANCSKLTYDSTSGTLTVKTSGGTTVGSATEAGTVYLYCTSGGSCTTTNNQLTLS